MEIKEFQQKLSDTLTLAVKNGKKIHAEVVEGIFSAEGFTEMQLNKVYEYLRMQGIEIEGRKTGSIVNLPVTEEENGSAEEKQEACSLTSEEEEYIRDYEETMEELPKERPGEKEALFERVLQKEEEAKKRLTELYMADVVEIAKELKQKDIFIGDLISEGNIGLITALNTLEEASDRHVYIRGEIRNAMLFMIEEQADQKEQDDILVEKVRDLESRIKELLEDEESKYSVEEIATFLDMDVEEIEGVLRLTGDDK